MEHRTFYKSINGAYYMLVSEGREIGTDKDMCCLVDLYSDDDTPIIMSKVQMRILSMLECTQAEIFAPAKGNRDIIDKITRKIGVGDICPFCGGYLAWESDFMMSEMDLLGGDTGRAYVEITDEFVLDRLKLEENELINGNLLGTCDDIEAESKNAIDNYTYPTYVYMKEVKNGNTTYYQLNDAVIGVYTCTNCGKKYEITDCLPSEEKNYPFFQ